MLIPLLVQHRRRKVSSETQHHRASDSLPAAAAAADYTSSDDDATSDPPYQRLLSDPADALVSDQISTGVSAFLCFFLLPVSYCSLGYSVGLLLLSINRRNNTFSDKSTSHHHSFNNVVYKKIVGPKFIFEIFRPIRQNVEKDMTFENLKSHFLHPLLLLLLVHSAPSNANI